MCGEHGVVPDERDVGFEALPAGKLDDALEQERRRLLLAYALRLGFRHGFRDARLDRRLFQRVIQGNWIGDEEPAGTDLALKPNCASEIVKPIATMFEL